MKIESRPKHPGVKWHLDEVECQALLNWKQERKLSGATNNSNEWAVNFCKKLAKQIRELQKENPKLLVERTPDEVAEALEKDKQKILEQQKAMQSGKDWKKVK